MKKINSKGFTLIELLAVIVIMGILMMVAIPAVSRTIENSRKDTFMDIAKSYANSVKNLWAADGIVCKDKGGTTADITVSTALAAGDYYIKIDTSDNTGSLIQLIEQGGKSSWGNRNVYGYVRVNIGANAKGDRITKYYVNLTDGLHTIASDYDGTNHYDATKNPGDTGYLAPIESADLRRSHVITKAATALKTDAILTTPYYKDTGCIEE